MIVSPSVLPQLPYDAIQDQSLDLASKQVDWSELDSRRPTSEFTPAVMEELLPGSLHTVDPRTASHRGEPRP